MHSCDWDYIWEISLFAADSDELPFKKIYDDYKTNTEKENCKKVYFEFPANI